MAKKVAILVFKDVELLDFCGPYEVFSMADRIYNGDMFDVYTVSEDGKSLFTKNGLEVKPEYSIFNCPSPDIMIIPGGQGTRVEMHNGVLLEWIKECERGCEMLISVCTGAFLLANCGFLAGRKATTHHMSFDLLQELEPKCEVVRGERFIDSGKIITSGGISAGIDVSLYAVSKICGQEATEKIKEIMEYDWDFGS